MADAGRAAGKLAEYRPLADAYGPLFTATGNPMGEALTRLLKVAEEALALASAWERAGGDGDPVHLVHVERRACGSDLRAAIERALTGEDGSDHD